MVVLSYAELGRAPHEGIARQHFASTIVPLSFKVKRYVAAD